jgi:hypothetical protein
MQTFFSSLGTNLICFVARPAMMAKLAVRVNDRGTTFQAAIDELRPT